MIHYHGTPFGGTNSEASEALIGRHAFVSFAAQQQLQVALDVCQSVALDNGAFTAWKQGKNLDVQAYMTWAAGLMRHPRVDWAIIPDVIEGGEDANQQLMDEWDAFFGPDARTFGVPVWHMHESSDKLGYLLTHYPRLAIGSSAEYSTVGTKAWHERMEWAMSFICDENGLPKSKVHMLRGLNPAVFTKYPFASADSTNAARNCNMDTRWNGVYAPPTTGWRARVIMARIESHTSAERFVVSQSICNHKDSTNEDWCDIQRGGY